MKVKLVTLSLIMLNSFVFAQEALSRKVCCRTGDGDVCWSNDRCDFGEAQDSSRCSTSTLTCREYNEQMPYGSPVKK